VRISAALIVLLALLSAVFIVSTEASANGNILIYVFGSEDCPYSIPEYQWLVETYGKDLVYFCDVNITACGERFSNLTKLGLPPATPMVIVVNGTVRAIFIGDVKDKSFVNMLLSFPVYNKIPVFLGSKVETWLDGSNETREFIMRDIILIPPPPSKAVKVALSSSEKTVDTASMPSTSYSPIKISTAKAFPIAMVVVSLAVVWALGKAVKRKVA
jgi:hypothetical protein